MEQKKHFMVAPGYGHTRETARVLRLALYRVGMDKSQVYAVFEEIRKLEGR